MPYAANPTTATVCVTGPNERDDHEPPAVRQGAHLECNPDQGEQATGRRRRRRRDRPDVHTDAAAPLDVPKHDLDRSTAEQHEDEPRTQRGRRSPTERRVHDPAPVRVGALPAFRDEPDPGPHRDGRHGGAVARSHAADPIRWRAEEHDRKRQDRGESRKDEREAAHDGAHRPGDAPGTEDRQLGGGGAGQQVARGNGVLELVRCQPLLPVDAELAQQSDVRRRSTEARVTDSSPLRDDVAQGARSCHSAVHAAPRAHVPASLETTGANASNWSSPSTTYETPHSSRRFVRRSQHSSTVPTSATPDSSATSGSSPKPGAIASASARRSSVRDVMKYRIWSSRSSKRSPAPSRTHSIFCLVIAAIESWTASGLTSPARRFGLMPTMSASRPASRSSRGPPPPTRIGGWGFCAGFGIPS